MLNLTTSDKNTSQAQNLIHRGPEKTDGQLARQANIFLDSYFVSRADNAFEDVRFFQKQRKRIVLKRGLENFLVVLEDIAFFYSENKIAYAIDHTGTKYLAEFNLIELEKELDKAFFFRANRQFIININYIGSFRNYERVKIKVSMRPEQLNSKYVIIISQDRARLFRQWVQAA